MEVGNKASFMGIYGLEMVLPPGPPEGAQLMLPRFVIVAWLFGDIDDRPERVSVRVYGPPGKTHLFKLDLPPSPPGRPASPFDDPTKFFINIPMPLVNFIIQGEGVIVVEIETERETIRAGRLRVRIDDEAPPATPETGLRNPSAPREPQPPSGQSPSVAPASKPRRARARPSTRRSAQTPELE